jgi:hypothetical protein
MWIGRTELPLWSSKIPVCCCRSFNISFHKTELSICIATLQLICDYCE